MYRSGSESLQSTIEAIVKNDNDELLQKFIEDEDIVDEGNIRKKLLGGWYFVTDFINRSGP